MARMDRLEPAEGERDTGKCASPGRKLEAAGVDVGRGDERHVMQPHREPIGRRDVEDAVEHQVRRIKRGDVALGDERNAQPEPVAPERQPARGEAARQLALERAIQPVRVAAHRLVADEQPAEDGAHQCHRQRERRGATGCRGETKIGSHQLWRGLDHFFLSERRFLSMPADCIARSCRRASQHRLSDSGIARWHVSRPLRGVMIARRGIHAMQSNESRLLGNAGGFVIFTIAGMMCGLLVGSVRSWLGPGDEFARIGWVVSGAVMGTVSGLGLAILLAARERGTFRSLKKTMAFVVVAAVVVWAIVWLLREVIRER